MMRQLLATRFSGRMRVVAILATSALVLGTNVARADPPPAPTPTATSYYAVTPTRVLDTRTGIGAPKAVIGARQNLDVNVPGVPSGAIAVAVNLTVTQVTGVSFLTLFAKGTARPNTSTLNWLYATNTVANGVIVKVDSQQNFTVYNQAGSANVVVDLLGYYAPGPAGETGPAGPAGPTGDTGAAGPAGETGAAGPAGPAGDTGPTGPPGAPGPAGDTGPAGALGLPGPAGEIGPAGPAGPAGVAGPAGPAGAKGDDGATGPAGAIGPAGPAGAVGPAGVAGPAGPAGAKGDDGAAGPAGAIGPAGPAGAKGDDGAAGLAGATGATGAVGPAGPAGLSPVGAYFEAQRTSPTLIEPNAALTFEAQTVNVGGFLYNGSTGEIAVPATGFYRLMMSASLSGNGGAQFGVWVNGTYRGPTFGQQAGEQMQGSAIVGLSAGDIVTLQSHTSSGDASHRVFLSFHDGGTSANVIASIDLELLPAGTAPDVARPSTKKKG